MDSKLNLVFLLIVCDLITSGSFCQQCLTIQKPQKQGLETQVEAEAKAQGNGEAEIEAEAQHLKKNIPATGIKNVSASGVMASFNQPHFL